jgi:hypothetical protein
MSKDPEYKTPINQLVNLARVYNAQRSRRADAQLGYALQLAGSGSPHRALCIDGAGDRGRTLFQHPAHRSLHPQFRLYRQPATGNAGGDFLIVGPGWNGDAPDGIDKVIRAETELVIAIYRTQLFYPGDMDNVKAVQAGYKVYSHSPRLPTGWRPKRRPPSTLSSR